MQNALKRGATFIFRSGFLLADLARSIDNIALCSDYLKHENETVEILFLLSPSEANLAKFILLAAASKNLSFKIRLISANDSLSSALVECETEKFVLVDHSATIDPSNFALFLKAATESGAAVAYGNLLQTDGLRSKLAGHDLLHSSASQNMPDLGMCIFDKSLALSAGAGALTEFNNSKIASLLLSCEAPICFIPILVGQASLNRVEDLLVGEGGVLERNANQFIGRMYHPEFGFLT